MLNTYYVVRDTFKREVKNTESYKLLKSLGSIKTLSVVHLFEINPITLKVRER